MQKETSKKNRNKLLLVFAVFGIPVVISYLAYYVFPPKGAVTNYGELIKPVSLSADISLSKPDGAPVTLKSLRGKWLLVHVDSGACDASCERDLYAMRQTRLLQGKDQDRVERIWVLTDKLAPQPALLREHQGIMLLRDGSGAFLSKLPAKTKVQDHIYVIDPLGNVMMRYDRNPDIKRMGKDLEKLLRASQIG